MSWDIAQRAVGVVFTKVFTATYYPVGYGEGGDTDWITQESGQPRGKSVLYKIYNNRH